MTVISRSWRQLAAISSLALLAACSSSGPMQSNQPTPTSIDYNSSFRMTPAGGGSVLSTDGGMTLYTYDIDTSNQSACYGECARNWPPYLADADAKPNGDLTLIARSDGTRQWAESGRPLYTFVQDTSPGEYRGDDFNNVWHVVRDDRQPATQASNQTTSQVKTSQASDQAPYLTTYQPTNQPSYQLTALPYNASFRTVQTGSGDVLSTSRGMTLYTYESDARNSSNCYGECARYWQPYLGSVTAPTGGDLTLIARADGTSQWADNGQPLYTYFEDTSPGDTKGLTHSKWQLVR